MSLRISVLLSLAQVWLSMSQFMFELEVDLDSVIANSIQCGHLFFDKRECDVYFSVFCLREGRDDSQSTRNEGNCPLGRNTDRMNTYVENESNMRRITSQRPWPIKFQLYIEARNYDPAPNSEFNGGLLDAIFIERILEVNSSFTELEQYTGFLNTVSFQMKFRVMCQQDYYGVDCNVFCLAQSDDVNGHYTCDRNGSIQCLEGFENPNNSCRDMINPCYSSPCANNGSCVPMGPFDYTCQCAVGYTGLTCEIDIDHCLSALCSNNSMCVDGVNSYECICYPDFMLDEDRCVNQMENQGTPIPVTSSFATEAANGNKITIYYGVAAAVALTVIAIIAFTMALIVVIIKWRRKRIHCAHQAVTNLTSDREQLNSLSLKIYMEDNQAYGQFSSLKMEDNPAYGQFSHYQKEPQEQNSFS